MNARRRHDRVSLDGVGPVRTCIVSRVARPTDSLLRFALSPDAEVVADLASSLPGRGAWVTSTKEIVGQAVEKRAFDRVWRRKVVTPSDLAEQVEQLLVRRALQALSMANKAGQLLTGFGNVDQCIGREADIVLVQAWDASADGRRKLAGRYKSVCAATCRSPEIVLLFSIEQLSLAIGSTNVVHAALNRGKVADAVVRAARRAEQYRANVVPGDDLLTVSENMLESPTESANDLGREAEQV